MADSDDDAAVSIASPKNSETDRLSPKISTLTKLPSSPTLIDVPSLDETKNVKNGTIFGHKRSKSECVSSINPHSSGKSIKMYKMIKNSSGTLMKIGVTKSKDVLGSDAEEILSLEEHLLRKRAPRRSSSSITGSSHNTTLCGLGPYRPRYLQRFATPGWMLFFLCWYCLMQGVIVSGLAPSTLTSIEKRYNFPDYMLGRIMQCYEIGYVLTCIPVSYFGGRHSKPLFLGFGLLILSIGAFLYSLPHFKSEFYVLKQMDVTGACNQSLINISRFIAVNQTAVQSSSSSSCEKMNQDTSWQVVERARYLLLFCFAQFLNGIGTTPLMTLGVSYIDENVKPTHSPVYIGVFYAFIIFGPAIGFTMTASLSGLDVDFLSAPQDKPLIIGKMEPDRVGAWWLGFLIAGLVSFLAVIPIMSFPRVLPGAGKYQEMRMKQANKRRNDSGRSLSSTSSTKQVAKRTKPVHIDESENQCWSRLKSDFKHIPKAIMRIITNPSYVCITMSATVEGILISGLLGFMPKYLERQFSLETRRTNFLIGFIMVPFAGIGVLSSGYIIKRYALNCTKSIKYCIIASVLATILTPMFLVSCPAHDLVGVTTTYEDSMISDDSGQPKEPALLSACNSHCKCDEFSYNPVCALEPNGRARTYFSSCFAGCPEPFDSKRANYHNCTCPTKGSKIKGGPCIVNCSALTVFLVLFAPMVFFTFSIGVPALSVVLRCVDYDERPFALAIQWIVIRIIGMIPAPVIFGKLMELACLVSRKKPCDDSIGFCYLYDNDRLATLFLTSAFIGHILACVFLILALIFFKRSGREDVGYDDNVGGDQNEDAKVKV